jgi:hypothetical protein
MEPSRQSCRGVAVVLVAASPREPSHHVDHRDWPTQRSRLHVPVGYHRDGEHVSIVVGWPNRKLWWRNLRNGGSVRLRLRGEERTGRAQVHGKEQTGVKVEVQLDPPV